MRYEQRMGHSHVKVVGVLSKATPMMNAVVKMNGLIAGSRERGTLFCVVCWNCVLAGGHSGCCKSFGSQ